MITILNLVTTTDISGTPIARAALVLISNGVNTYKLAVGGIPLTGDAQAYLDGIEVQLLADAQANGAVLSAQEVWRLQQSPLVIYYASIIKSLYDDVDNGGVTLVQLLTNAANIVATNPTQAAKFSAYRTRMGLDGSIATMTVAQQRNLLALGLEWAAAGLAVAETLD